MHIITAVSLTCGLFGVLTVFLEDVEKNKTVQCQVQILFPVEFKRKETTGKNIRKSGNTGKKKKTSGTWKTVPALNKKANFRNHSITKKAHQGDGHFVFYVVYEK